MLHLDTELRFISPEMGYGVFATRMIPRGTITWAQDEFDQVISAARMANLPEIQQQIVDKYAFISAQGEYVLCWDLGRYINHSCDPTSRGVGPHMEIAVRDIQVGEELTSDYAEMGGAPDLICNCGAANCRGRMHSDDLEHFFHEWDVVVEKAFALLDRVEQPLWPLVRDKEFIEAMVRGERSVPSRLQYRSRRPASVSDVQSANWGK